MVVGAEGKLLTAMFTCSAVVVDSGNLSLKRRNLKLIGRSSFCAVILSPLLGVICL